MLRIFALTLPIFALILAGWGARRIGVLGPGATGELNRYVVWLALPALLFGIVVNARGQVIWQPAFMASFALGALAVFGATLALRMRGKHLADAAVDGLNSAYANTGYLGFPLLLAVLGPASLGLTMIATILTACVLFALALILIEIGLQAEAAPLDMIRRVAASLTGNPLLMAPLLGGVCLMVGLRMPAPVNSFLKLLGDSASPCALVGLGLFLAEAREDSGDRLASGMFTALKLIVHPALTWLLASRVFHLDATLTRTAVLLAALPTGTGPFMVAEFYRRDALITSDTILLSTIGSLVTVPAVLALMG